ncbi:MAG TPA: rod shape-determining protein MreC [Bryobacteraceae bacterium]|nr:rod shape-determining protein MreC [Bryobacteraceae bacterium]
MESFLNRYRNLTVLLLVIFAQLVLLAVQVKNAQDVRMIRVWAVSAVTPAARVMEWFRGGSIGFVRNYILMHDASEENRHLRDELGRTRMENTFLRNELATAERAKALQLFEAHTPSKMLAASIIGTGAGANSKVVFISRGSAEGVMRGMAVVTPDGIVGEVIAAYPTASEVLLVTDPDFAAGVIGQKSQVRGTLKGQGNPMCKVDYVPPGEKVQAGEVFYTSGDDRIFPRGFTVGVARVVRPAQPFQEILVEPAGLQHGLEDVLIILDPVHQSIPAAPPANQPVFLAPAPPENPAPAATTGDASPSATPSPAAGTDADKLRAIYQSVGAAENHNFGTGPPGTKPPDFTKLPSSPLPPPAPGAANAPKTATGGRAPASTQHAEPRPATVARPPVPAAKKSVTPPAVAPNAGETAKPPEPRPAAVKPPAKQPPPAPPPQQQ